MLHAIPHLLFCANLVVANGIDKYLTSCFMHLRRNPLFALLRDYSSSDKNVEREKETRKIEREREREAKR